MDIVNLAIQMGLNDWNDGLYGACEGGHLDVVHFMIQMGADQWDNGLDACWCGEGDWMKIADLMIKNGAEYDYDAKQYNHRLLEACIYKKCILSCVLSLPILNLDTRRMVGTYL